MFPAITISSVYFACLCFASLPIVRPQDHDVIQLLNTAYGLFGVLTSLYVLLQPVETGNNGACHQIVWSVTAHVGAIAFAAAAQIPWLRDFTITKDGITHADVRSLFILVPFSVCVLICLAIQFREAYRTTWCHFKLQMLCAFILIYAIVFVTMILSSVSHIYLHVHHTIAAGTMMILLCDLKSYTDIICHAVFTGIYIEGIAFFHGLECELFMIKHNIALRFAALITLWVASIVISIVCMALARHPHPVLRGTD